MVEQKELCIQDYSLPRQTDSHANKEKRGTTVEQRGRVADDLNDDLKKVVPFKLSLFFGQHRYEQQRFQVEIS